MYYYLLIAHSFVRWLVLFFLVYSIYRAFTGFTKNKAFSKTDNAFRHWTATVAHIQLMIGIILYSKSSLVQFFWTNKPLAFHDLEFSFYAVIHLLLMLIAIVILTTGSALVKRKVSDKEKFQTMLIWFSVALLIIFISIPWQFSPLSQRPYLRTF